MGKNKYREHSKVRESRRSWGRWRQCERKDGFDSREEAEEKGKGYKVYKCPHCEKWHRSDPRSILRTF